MKQTFFQYKNSFLKLFFLFLLFSSFLHGTNGLTGKYYYNTSFSGNYLTQVDPIIHMNWFKNKGPIVSPIKNEYYSIEWNGFLYAPQTGNYTFTTRQNDASKLYLENELILENNGMGETKTSRWVYLTKGFIPIKIRYYQLTDGAGMHLFWRKPGSSTQIIPTENLFTRMPIIQTYSTTVTEGEVARVKVEVNGTIPSGSSIEVDYSTQNGTARSPTNYTSKRGTLRFTNANKVQYINIQTRDDGVIPSTDPLKFRVNLSGSYLQETLSTEVGIKNKKEMRVGFAQSSYTGNEGSNLQFTVALNEPATRAFTVKYKTRDGTANARSDYAPQDGTLSFSVGERTKTINVPLLADSDVTEPDENFFMDLIATSSTPTISRKTAQGIIKNIDPNTPSLRFTQSVYKGEEGEMLSFVLVLDKQPTTNFSVRFRTKDGTASASSDYEAKDTTLYFGPSSPLTRSVAIRLLNDSNDFEPDEDFTVEITTTSLHVKILTPSATGIIKGKNQISDDEDVIDSFKDCNRNKTACKSVNLQKDFKLRFGGRGYAIYGDMTATGESVICPKGDDYQGCNWQSTTAVEFETTKSINEVGFTKNSSKANLVLPNFVNKGSHIAFARLYWQGIVSERYAASTNQLKSYIRGWSSIRFKTPIGEHELQAKPSDTNWLSFWGTAYQGRTAYPGGRFAYQASADVTQIIKEYIDSPTFQNTKNKTFAAGNIVASTEGKDKYMTFHTLRPAYDYGVSIWGHWAGWSLVVVYDVGELVEDVKYKNVAIYDGFTFLIPWYDNGKYDSISLDVDGFYTPTSGSVDASMTLFSGSGNGVKHPAEGSFELYNSRTNKWHKVHNDLNPEDQPLNGSYTYKNQPLVTGRKNHAATDLDTFDVSQYMSNRQTSATLRLSGVLAGKPESAYSSLPSMLAFTTEIYSPNVCYEENIYYQNKKVPFEIVPPVGSTLNTQLSIRNEGYEDAEKIRFWTSFDQNFSYQKDSLLVGNADSNGIATPLVPNSPLATIAYPNEFNDSNISLYLGRGATASTGGDFKAMRNFGTNRKDEARVDYNMTFYDPEFKVRKYFVEYENKTLGLQYKGRIYECLDTNRSFNAPILGDFNIVNENFSGSQISSDPKHQKNALYTQVVGQEFSVKILSLKEKDSSSKTKELNKFTGDVSIDLVRTINYEQCGQNDTQCHERNEQKCKTPQIISSSKKVNFNDQSTITEKFTFNVASQKAIFRVLYKDGTNTTRCATSLDSFAIRPAKYSIDLNESAPYIGGREYKPEVNATANTSNSTTPLYTTFPNDINFSVNSNFPAGCLVGADNKQYVNARFGNGAMLPVPGFETKNIGDYNVSVHDTKWTSTDQNKTYKGRSYDDCIPGSSQITHNSQGKVGCEIHTIKSFSFGPRAFRNNLNLANFNGGGFTYVADNRTSSSLEMNATITLDVEAILDINATQTLWTADIATAYDKNCFAKDIDLTLQLLNNPADWEYPTSAASRILFQSDNDTTTRVLTQPRDGNVTITSSEGNFTNGANQMTLFFNFDRNISQAQNPFNILRSDFNITKVENSAGVKGEDINRTIADTSARFYYGRIHAPWDYYRGPSPLSTRIYYEVYCDGCNRLLYGINGDESIDSMNWFINPLHVNTDLGEVPAPHVPSTTGNYRSVSGDSTMQGAVTFNANGTEDVVWTNPNAPTIDRIELYADSWLIFNAFNPNADNNDYNIEFTGDGNWAGEGALGEVSELNISNRVNKRLEW